MRVVCQFPFLLAFPLALAAQDRQPTGAFIVRLGTDTTAVERFTRSGNSYQVEQALRSPRTSFRHTHLEVTPTGHVATTFLMLHSIDNPSGPLLGSTKLTHGAGDSATVEIKQGDSTRTRRVPLPAGAIPSLPQSFLGYELAAMRVRETKADSMSITLVNPSGDQTPIVVRRVGADSMTFTLPFLTYRAHVDASGRITRLYQPRGTSVERVANADVNAIAKAWAALDAAGKGMGPLSPRDSTSVRIGDATIRVRYARPSKRGRVIFGDIVPWDTVWRTGANDATVFTSDTDLLIGNEMVHAGSYTLFTIPSRNGTTLIINREIMRGGEPLAGTDYDSSKDLARIPMTTKTLATPVEKLTIEVIPRGNEGVLRIVWDRREMTVPIRLRS
ncbi:MAG TPA: DUF2911 domain-containing protein [Gemmatimonadaceae bacterium]|nr:DUF2911 domain-containing protein [Gemmatimonadaceae bacterium]